MSSILYLRPFNNPMQEFISTWIRIHPIPIYFNLNKNALKVLFVNIGQTIIKNKNHLYLYGWFVGLGLPCRARYTILIDQHLCLILTCKYLGGSPERNPIAPNTFFPHNFAMSSGKESCILYWLDPITQKKILAWTLSLFSVFHPIDIGFGSKSTFLVKLVSWSGSRSSRCETSAPKYKNI